MSKIIMEFDDNEIDNLELLAIIERRKLISKIDDLYNLYLSIYKGNIPEDSFKEGYIKRQWIENELNYILENIKHLLY